MDSKTITDNIAYCGLVCRMCHLADRCDGCRSASNCCGTHTSAAGCFQYDCCVAKGFEGCWECQEFPCGEGMFSENHDVRIRAFVRFIRTHGKDRLAIRLLENARNGIHYGHGRDYDNLGSEAKVLELLLGGEQSADRALPARNDLPQSCERRGSIPLL